MIFTVNRFCYCCDLRKGIIGCGAIFGVLAVFLLSALQSTEITLSTRGRWSWTFYEYALLVIIRGGIAAGIMETVGSFILVYGAIERKKEPISFWLSSSFIILLLEAIIIPAYGILTGYLFVVLCALPVFLFKLYFIAVVYSYLKVLKKIIEDRNIIKSISLNTQVNELPSEHQPPPSYTENI